MANRGQRFNSLASLTGTRREVQEKTVYIYMTRQHFSEVCTWTSEAGMVDLFSPASSAANVLDGGESFAVNGTQLRFCDPQYKRRIIS